MRSWPSSTGPRPPWSLQSLPIPFQATNSSISEASVTLEWAGLVAGSATGRRAIYGERFPARWDELEAAVGIIDFTEHEAGQLLTVFATHWDHLPIAADRDDIRYHLVVLALAATSVKVAIAFHARALRPDRVVVAYPVLVRQI